MGDTSKDQRGHEVERPKQIPFKGWKDIALRVKKRVLKDHIPMVSAGIAFAFFLAIFPALAATLSIYGLLVEPEQVGKQMSQLTGILPGQAHQMISNILEGQSEKSSASLGWGLVLSLIISLWTANLGTRAVFKGVNIAYSEIDKRGFVRATALTLLFTIGGIVVAIIAMVIVVAFPALIDMIGLPSTLEKIIQLLRWPLLAILVMFSLALVYKIAPYRTNPKFRWTSWGAIIATVLWLAGTLLFNLYVSNFKSIDSTYGSFAAVIVLMLWFLLAAFIILLGAEINSEMEHQTKRDTTTGKEKPMGQRGAYYADHFAGEDQENKK